MRFRPPSIAILFSLIMLASAPAWAGGFLSPFIGNNSVFVGDTGHCPSAADCSSKHFTYDFSFGFMSGDAIGVEEDISYAPHFFFGRVPLFGNNSLFSGMTNLILGVPPGPIRPYVSGGGGLVHTKAHLALSSLDNGNDTSPGYDLGGGLMAFIAPYVGIRGDYRYIRTTKDFTLGDFSINNQKLGFSRASAGVVFQF